MLEPNEAVLFGIPLTVWIRGGDSPPFIVGIYSAYQRDERSRLRKIASGATVDDPVGQRFKLHSYQNESAVALLSFAESYL
jgi:hypothetical protein